MKKKILFGFSVFTILVVLVFNVAIAQKGTNADLSVNFLCLSTLAQAESGTTTKCESSTLCTEGNGLHYGTMTWEAGNITCCGLASVTSGKKSS